MVLFHVIEIVVVSRSGIDIVVVSHNKSKFGDRVDHIYHIEREIKDITDTSRSASYLDIQMKT